MQGLRPLGCLVVVLLVMSGGALWAAKILVEEVSSKEAKPEASVVPQEERERQARLEITLATKARREAYEKRLKEQGATVNGTLSSSSSTSIAAPAEESETVLPTPYAGMQILGLDADDEEKEPVTKEAEATVKAMASVETKESKEVEETATIIIKAEDKSEAAVALAWLLQLPPVRKTFVGMHNVEQKSYFDAKHKVAAQTYQGDEKCCVYAENRLERIEKCSICEQVHKQIAQTCCSCSDDKIVRVADCPLCKRVIAAWFTDTNNRPVLKNKRQLVMMAYALHLVYKGYAAKSPRDLAFYLAEQLAVTSAQKPVFEESDLITLWREAWRLELTLLATAAAIQLRKIIKDVPATKVARERFFQEHQLAGPLIDQMEFEKMYANGKAPALSIATLRAYSFLPISAGDTVDKVWEVIKQNQQQVEPLLRQLPKGAIATALWKKAAAMLAVRYACAADFMKHYQELPVGRNDNDPRSLMISAMKRLAVLMVQRKDFDRIVFDRIPEVYFKYLLRLAYFARNRTMIDELPIDHISECLKTWPRIDLSNLQLADVSWLTEVVALTNETKPLEALVLDNNKIAALPNGLLQTCTGLLMFSAANNEIVNVPLGFFDAATRVQIIDLSNNRIGFFPAGFLADTPELRKFNASNNALTALPETCLQNSPKLFLLGLQENKIASFSDRFLRGCYALQYLYFTRNKLSRFTDDFLQDCTDIRVVFLDHNDITEVPKAFLQNHPYLRKLYIDHNKLGALPDGFLGKCPHLEVVSVLDNPWTVKRPNAQMKALVKKIGRRNVGYFFPWWYWE